MLPLNDIAIMLITPHYGYLLYSNRSIFTCHLLRNGRTNVLHVHLAKHNGSTTDDGMPTDDGHDALRRRRLCLFVNVNLPYEAVGINSIFLSSAPFACA